MTSVEDVLYMVLQAFEVRQFFCFDSALKLGVHRALRTFTETLSHTG